MEEGGGRKEEGEGKGRGGVGFVLGLKRRRRGCLCSSLFSSLFFFAHPFRPLARDGGGRNPG